MPLFIEANMHQPTTTTTTTTTTVSTSVPQKYDSIIKAQPQSFAQWQKACAFVKFLYLQGFYDSCIAKSKELLALNKIHSAHKAFLHFYAALSHETRAESRGDDDADFHPNLNTAEHHLSAARGCLPAAHTHPTPALPPHARHDSYEAFKRDIASQRRSSSESSRPSTDLLSQRDSKSSHTTISNAVRAPLEPDTFVAGARGRYGRILASLEPQLEAHTSYIRALRQDGAAEGSSRRDRRAGDDARLRETLAKAAVTQRVADGRRRNWKRARFGLSTIEAVQTES